MTHVCRRIWGLFPLTLVKVGSNSGQGVTPLEVVLELFDLDL
jgi:hypothetical protein